MRCALTLALTLAGCAHTHVPDCATCDAVAQRRALTAYEHGRARSDANDRALLERIARLERASVTPISSAGAFAPGKE